MNLVNLNKTQLTAKIYELMDQVDNHLKTDPDVDKFLDKTNLFDEWEVVLPQEEYPIFIMAVLNNIRKETIIKVITESIINNGKIEEIKTMPYKKKDTKNISHVGETPFN